MDLWAMFQGGLESPAELPVCIVGTGQEAGCLESVDAFPLIQSRVGMASGFWDELSEPLCPAAGTGINTGRCG